MLYQQIDQRKKH